MMTKKLLSTVALAAMSAALIAAHPADSGDPGSDDNRGKALTLTTQAAVDAEDGAFGAYEDGSGDVKLWVDQRNDRVCMNGSFELQEGDTVNLLHIHEKDADSDNPQTGPVVASWDRYIDFADGDDDGDTSTGITSLNWCVDSETAGWGLDDVRDLLNESSDYYINAHVFTDDGAPVIRAELDKDLEL